MNKEVLISVNNLCKYFKAGRDKTVKAVDYVNFDIYKGETLGLVGESGCGKTTCGRTILGMYTPTSGSVLFNGVDISSFDKDAQLSYKKKAQYIFQDPYASLDPRLTVSQIISEGMDVHFQYSKEERSEKVNDLLEKVGLNKEHALRYPHELSGGQRQRVGIARSLAVQPEFLVCDEPISALDVSVQAQIINLLNDLKDEMGLTYMFISHDLSTVKYMSSRIAVMYLGSVVELAEGDSIYNNPMHPYTIALMSAIPVPDPKAGMKKRIALSGEIPSQINPPPGCKFVNRCPHAKQECHEKAPTIEEKSSGHFVACYSVE